MRNSDILNDYVPHISKAEFDGEATRFLKQYCPEALETPMAVPIETIARKKMGLVVLERNLTEDLSILGQMCFTGGLAEIYDKAEDEYREIRVKAGTMIIDPDTEIKRNIGCKRNTISHECFHWDKHRFYHILANAAGKKDTAVAFRCPSEVKDDRTTADWTDEDWMEWQATSIAPRILMPKETVGIVVARLCDESKTDPFVATKLKSQMRWVVERLAAFYDVSKQSAEIRLVELGYLHV